MSEIITISNGILTAKISTRGAEIVSLKKYDLDGKTLYVEYIVTNLDNKKMYFSVSSHEAYVCPEGIEEYSLIFEQKENLEISLLEGAFLSHKTETFGLYSELPLKYSYFDRDALIFRKLNSRRVALKNRNTGRTILVNFDGIDNLIIWTKNNVKFLCIEPWCGLPDYIDTDHDLTKKADILELDPNSIISKKHSITF